MCREKNTASPKISFNIFEPELKEICNSLGMKFARVGFFFFPEIITVAFWGKNMYGYPKVRSTGEKKKSCWDFIFLFSFSYMYCYRDISGRNFPMPINEMNSSQDGFVKLHCSQVLFTWLYCKSSNLIAWESHWDLKKKLGLNKLGGVINQLQSYQQYIHRYTYHSIKHSLAVFKHLKC